MATSASNEPKTRMSTLSEELNYQNTEFLKNDPLGGTESPSHSHAISLDPITHDSLSDNSFGKSLVSTKPADDKLHTAAPCPVCEDFTSVKIVDIESAKSQASAGCLGCKLIGYAKEHFVQKIIRDLPELLFREGTEQTVKISMAHHNIWALSDRHLQEYEIFTPTIAYHLPKYIKRRRPISISSGSLNSFTRIAEWLKDCRSHSTCQQLDTQLPSRILDIDCPEGIQLKLGTNLSGLYCALSHCWGTAEHLPTQTTKGTLLARQTRIEEHSLSKTFRDAITLARYLSIRYLWIDSLCIIQDDKDNWDRESARMATTYQNAYLVIAATHAKHGDIGCFSDRSGPIFCYNILHADGQQIPVYIGDKQDHRHFTQSTMYWPDDRYPLLSRAWCLQERLLATRLIHFAGEELIWECRTGMFCECGVLDEDSEYDSCQREWAMDLDSFRLFYLWHKTVQMYSHLEMTYASDKLPALSGLAKHLQSRGYGEYVAGMWVQHIFEDLMWYGGKIGTEGCSEKRTNF